MLLNQKRNHRLYNITKFLHLQYDINLKNLPFGRFFKFYDLLLIEIKL